jgi:nicotinamidase/pyrazinamidase
MKALILVDIQYDFVPGGALAVPRGDEAAAVANRLMPRFPLVIATQDWHPVDHGSFAANHPGRLPGEVITLGGLRQVLWPVHCVQGTRGAELLAELDRARIAAVVHKGDDPEIDSYSAFFDNGGRKATELAGLLRDRGVEEIHLVGLATDYCVKYSALDARRLGFATHVILEGCRGIDLVPGDVDRALEEMCAAGVVLHPG